MSELPQRLKAQLEHGKLSLAVTIEPYRKADELHGDLLVGISNVVDSRVARGLPLEESLAHLTDVTRRIAREGQYRRVGSRVIICVLLLVLAACTVITWRMLRE